MMNSNPYGLISPSQMSYVLNNPIANSVLNSAKVSTDNSIQEQIARLQETNATLQRKLHSKSMENEKMRNRLEKLEGELDNYKTLLTRINHAISNGESPPSIANALQAIVATTEKVKYSASSAASSSVSKPKSHLAKKSKPASTNCACCMVTDKPYKCEWEGCLKRFKQKAHLEAHSAIHTGRRFICDVPGCGKSFVRKYNLCEHKKSHTPNNPNRCHYQGCGQTFSTKHGLMRHQNAQHNISPYSKID